MKKVWVGIIAGVLVFAIAGGSFWGGMVYGRSQASQAGVPFSREGFTGRGGGQFPGAMVTRQAGQGDATQLGNGVMGTIQEIDGQVLVINTGQETVRVQVSDTTLIQKTMPVGIDALEVDEQVIVMGRQNDDGSITARSIQPFRAPQFGQPSGGQ
jgi:hypothetical protein